MWLRVANTSVHFYTAIFTIVKCYLSSFWDITSNCLLVAVVAWGLISIISLLKCHYQGGCAWLTVANTPANYSMELITGVKCFMIQALLHWLTIIMHFFKTKLLFIQIIGVIKFWQWFLMVKATITQIEQCICCWILRQIASFSFSHTFYPVLKFLKVCGLPILVPTSYTHLHLLESVEKAHWRKNPKVYLSVESEYKEK